MGQWAMGKERLKCETKHSLERYSFVVHWTLVEANPSMLDAPPLEIWHIALRAVD